MITRVDLSPSVQTVQVAHALAELIGSFPVECKFWNKAGSNSLVVTEVINEEELCKLIRILQKKGIKRIAEFREPDLLNELTAVAVLPNSEDRKHLGHLSLLGKKSKTPEEIQVLREREKEKKKLSIAMATTEQTKGVSIVKHGELVWEATQAVLQAVENNQAVIEFYGETHKLPGWFAVEKMKFLEAVRTLGMFSLQKYCLLHDIGKPEVFTVDESTGAFSFPNHAEKSAEVFKRVYGEQYSNVCELIKKDMEVHLLKPGDNEGISRFASLKNVLIHLLVGFAELCANSKPVFGGMETESYKIKHKRFCRVGANTILRVFEGTQEQTKPSHTVNKHNSPVVFNSFTP